MIICLHDIERRQYLGAIEVDGNSARALGGPERLVTGWLKEFGEQVDDFAESIETVELVAFVLWLKLEGPFSEPPGEVRLKRAEGVEDYLDWDDFPSHVYL